MAIERQGRIISKGECREKVFCDKIEEHLHEILEHLGYKVKSITREYMQAKFFIDFLVTHENGFIVVEVKASNNKYSDTIPFANGIGQLLVYKTQFCLDKKVDFKKTEMMLIMDKKCPTLIDAVRVNNIDISMMVIIGDMVEYFERFTRDKTNE